MPMRLRTPMPALEGATEWFNAEGFDPSSLKNKPVLVHFWAVSCHICHEVMEEVVSYYDLYQDQGLKMIGIHMPKQQSDTDVDKVKRDISEYQITKYPVAIDNMHKLAEAFQNEFVPAFYLFGADGTLFYRAAGDKGFANVKPKIEQVLGLNPS